MQTIKFRSQAAREKQLAAAIRLNVTKYFAETGKSTHANGEMICKSLLWLGIWAISWYGVVFFKDMWLLAFAIGVIHLFTHVMLAFNVAHDANHGAMFQSARLNSIVGYLIELLGCNRRLWILAHNQEHHTFVNIHRHDNNITGYGMLRLCPAEKWFKWHRFQWLYAPIVYGTATIYYTTLRDIWLMFRYFRKSRNPLTVWFIVEFVFFKGIYFSYMFIIPVLVFHVNFGLILAYFIVGNFISGIFLALVFLVGHLTEETEYPMPDKLVVPTDWMAHVICTTGDYATDSGFMQWFAGGINLHVAHHLYPKICHVHYRRISGIIKRTVNEQGFEYREISTFSGALRSHFALLKTLGFPDK